MIGKSVFDVAQNDPNKAHKDIALEFLRLVGSGKPEDGLQATHKPHIKQ
jgi:hypothetical protein